MLKIQIPRSVLARNVQLSSAPGSKVRSRKSDPSSTPAAVSVRVHILEKPTPQKWVAALSEALESWQVTTAVVSGKDLLSSSTTAGPRIFLRRSPHKGEVSHSGQLEDSTRAWYREQGGAIFGLVKASTHDEIEIIGEGLDAEGWLGLFLGIELAAYQFKAEAFAKETSAGAGKALWSQNGWTPKIKVQNRGGRITPAALAKILAAAQTLGEATNFTRHLVNLPPNAANPTTISQSAKKLFSGRYGMKLEIWDEKKLRDENMGLHLGVGAGSPTPPCLVHLRYRPKNATKSKRPVALVGKGVTFDTGGLDIKPSAGMRLMKKDMGGAAAVLGLAYWASEVQYPAPLDFYLALAENSVDGNSMRPSDVLIARNGRSVEIHNTDAEGRLVLADALDVAVSRQGADEPELVIDLATLTGAIKVALGAEIAGLFSNDDQLSQDLERAGTEAGELSWRMPLLSRYASSFTSNFADLVNAVDGFGGAITAALFLERFVRNKSWAHLDIYAWNDKATGSLSFSGGNGQGVQTLANYLERRVQTSKRS